MLLIVVSKKVADKIFFLVKTFLISASELASKAHAAFSRLQSVGIFKIYFHTLVSGKKKKLGKKKT